MQGGILMVELLKQEILMHGDKFQILSIERLKDLKKDIEDFKNKEDLNGFQKYITNSLYQFELPATDFVIRSIIIIASPTPSYAKVIFNWHGKKIPLISLARSYIDKKDAPTATKQYLTEFLAPSGYHIKYAPQLPLKRLAVSSGLAVYGRNNICYVDGMGSFITLVAYFSDVLCIEDNWHEISQMDKCSDCTACLKNCPTGAISKERFLINNERCLSYFNESSGDFPEWLPKSVHHCLYDCLMCQNICPKNKDYINNVIGPIEFDEVETDLLLTRKSMIDFPLALKKKIRILGMDEWLSAIPRNIKILLENNEHT
jgi:epoxyqueuosine reductase